MRYTLNEIREIEKELNAMKLEAKKTDLSKEAFIQEIKNGLGEKIKENPNKVGIICPPKENIFKRFFKKLMKTF